MDLNDLLAIEGIDPTKTIVMRHKPFEKELNRVLPWLAAEKPAWFNAYQQAQGEKVERALEALQGDGYVASFIAHGAGKAVFVGLYRIASSRWITLEEYRRIPENVELTALGMRGYIVDDDRPMLLWFDLEETPVMSGWKGKLIVGWPPPERSWWRRAHRNVMPVVAIQEESLLDAAMPEWDRLQLSWEELAVMPTRWQAALRQWKGIYLIFDTSDGKSYVGSAYGETNILGRWLNYADTGHGGNLQLKTRNPKNFVYTIIQRVSPDMDADDVIRLESSWKDRLHTRSPFGLNSN